MPSPPRGFAWIVCVGVCAGGVTGCGTAEVAVDAGPCVALAGVYQTVIDATSVENDCPAFIVDGFADFGDVRVNEGRSCGPFQPGGGFAVDCIGGGCSGSTVIEAYADRDGVRDGTLTLLSSCADADCSIADPPCRYVARVSFVRLGPIPVDAGPRADANCPCDAAPAP